MVFTYIPPPEDFKDHDLLRLWWESIHSDQGPYKLYAFILVLASDKDAISYITDYGQELHQLSSWHTLIIVLGNIEFESGIFDSTSYNDLAENWTEIIDDYISKGHSVDIAQLFNIDYTMFPCMVFFRDIRSEDHVAVTFRDMKPYDISQRMRLIFSNIQEAIKEGEDPIDAIKRLQTHELFMSKGKSIIGTLGNIAEKSFETIMLAWAKATFGPVSP
jgi:hypothetical protein